MRKEKARLFLLKTQRMPAKSSAPVSYGSWFELQQKKVSKTSTIVEKAIPVILFRTKQKNYHNYQIAYL